MNKVAFSPKPRCGRAEGIYEMEGFWDDTIDLLCNEG